MVLGPGPRQFLRPHRPSRWPGHLVVCQHLGWSSCPGQQGEREVLRFATVPDADVGLLCKTVTGEWCFHRSGTLTACSCAVQLLGGVSLCKSLGAGCG